MIASKLWLTLTLLCCFCFSHIGPGHRDRVCITLEPAQLLKGDIMVEIFFFLRFLFRVFAISIGCSNDNVSACSFVG